MIFFSGRFVSKEGGEIDGGSRCMELEMLDHRSSVPGTNPDILANSNRGHRTAPVYNKLHPSAFSAQFRSPSNTLR